MGSGDYIIPLELKDKISNILKLLKIPAEWTVSFPTIQSMFADIDWYKEEDHKW